MDIKNTYFNFQGRIGRQIFWLYFVLPVFFLSAILQISVENQTSFLIIIPAFIVNIVLVVMLLAGFVKRLHDRGKSAWWLILIFIPIIGTIYWIIDLGILRGEDITNEYGSPAVPPKGVIDA